MSDSEALPLAKPSPIDSRVLFVLAGLAGLTAWIPVPVIDGVIDGWLRRRMVVGIANRHGTELDHAVVKVLADEPSRGCTGCLFMVAWWPIKKVIKTVLVFPEFKEMADIGSNVAHRGLMLEEAFTRGWLPAEPAKVRAAMDKTLDRTRYRPVERLLWGPYRDEDVDWQQAIARAATRERERATSGGEPTSPATAVSTQYPGLLPEILHAFRAEMGTAPDVETRVAGLIEPEVMVAETALEAKPDAPIVEDAEEIKP